MIKPRFSGHESFACRYAWLPKAYRALSNKPAGLADEETAMVRLGVGKNMVRSIRFWVEVMGVATPQAGREFELTSFGHAIFGPNGHDPFLEDIRTLWLLHWKVCTQVEEPVFAWRFMVSQWPHAEFTRSEALLAFQRESSRLGFSHSEVTLAQHLDVFLHTYVPSRAGSAAEDSLDGPLVELRLLQVAGERRIAGARRESVYAFRREPKPELTQQLFDYCLHDYWQQWHPEEATLTFRDVAISLGSVGQVFKLPEDDVRARLELYARPGDRAPFLYQPSAIQGLVARRDNRVPEASQLLRAVYEPASERAEAERRHA